MLLWFSKVCQKKIWDTVDSSQSLNYFQYFLWGTLRNNLIEELAY